MTTSFPHPEPAVLHIHDAAAHPRADLPVEEGRRLEDYEFQIVSIPPRMSIGAARAGLTERAEYGRWELARTRLYHGGGRKVWLRRRIIRVSSTL